MAIASPECTNKKLKPRQKQMTRRLYTIAVSVFFLLWLQANLHINIGFMVIFSILTKCTKVIIVSRKHFPIFTSVHQHINIPGILNTYLVEFVSLKNSFQWIYNLILLCTFAYKKTVS